ncbi:MAG TPA: hypothetical protein VF621_01225 [Pyrinomonadaceae bacterium]|jgi:hypothetical protein
MSASERPEQEPEGRPDKGEARLHVGRPPTGVQEPPLFLRGISDGSKGDAQDEKDEMGE